MQVAPGAANIWYVSFVCVAHTNAMWFINDAYNTQILTSYPNEFTLNRDSLAPWSIGWTFTCDSNIQRVYTCWRLETVR